MSLSTCTAFHCQGTFVPTLYYRICYSILHYATVVQMPARVSSSTVNVVLCRDEHKDYTVFHAIPSVNAAREHTGTEEAVKDRKHQRGLECFCCGIQYWNWTCPVLQPSIWFSTGPQFWALMHCLNAQPNSRFFQLTHCEASMCGRFGLWPAGSLT